MPTLTQHIQRYPADTQTPISLYLQFVGDEPGILLESAEVDGRLGRYSLIAWDFLLEIQARAGRLKCRIPDKRLKSLARFAESDFLSGLREIIDALNLEPEAGQPELPVITRSLIGYLAYESSALFEPKLAHLQQGEAEQAAMVLPGKQILFDHLHQRCFFIDLNTQDSGLNRIKEQKPDKPFQAGPVANDADKEEYCRKVRRIKEMIHAGQAIQVVQSVRFQAPCQGNAFGLYRRLRQENPSPYMFYLRFKDLLLAGSSPELMLRSTNNLLELRPIAGTRKRGGDRREDEELGRELKADPKERAEHVMLVDLGRNDLHRIAATGSLEVEKFMRLEKFSHVMHLTTYLKALLRPEIDAIEAIRACFPAGTLSGAPKIRAMEIIDQFEASPRGPYSGSVGWIGLDPDRVDLDMGIIIRSFWIRDQILTWRAGAGIVSDSEPEREWEECQNKARVIREILDQKGRQDAFTPR